jgi:predicted RNase H-like HicB family nuclease
MATRTARSKGRKSSAATHEIASFTVHFVPAAEGGYTVEVPALAGCVTEGDTFEEAERNAREAITLYLESLQARGLAIPDDRETVLPRISVPLHASVG